MQFLVVYTGLLFRVVGYFGVRLGFKFCIARPFTLAASNVRLVDGDSLLSIGTILGAEIYE